MYQLTPDEKAIAIKKAMRFEFIGFDNIDFYKYAWRLNKHKTKKLAMLEFLKTGTPMLQKMYLELISPKPIIRIQRIYEKSIQFLLNLVVYCGFCFGLAKVISEWIGG